MDRLQSSSPISIQAPLQWEGSVGVDRVQQGFSSHTSSFSSGRSGFLPPGCREAIGADVSWRGLSISTKRCWREKPSSFLPLNNPKTWHHRQKPKRGGGGGGKVESHRKDLSSLLKAWQLTPMPVFQEALIRLSFLLPKGYKNILLISETYIISSPSSPLHGI